MSNKTHNLDILNKYLKDLIIESEPDYMPRACAYRGQEKSWQLQSSAYRRVHQSADEQSPLDKPLILRQYVHQLLTDYRARGIDRLPVRSASDLEALSTLQHCGAATPLLDFTYNPLIALWFACHSNSKYNSNDGIIYRADITYALNPPLNGKATFDTVLESIQPPFDLVIWKPPYDYTTASRAAAQQSLHVLAGWEFGVNSIELSRIEPFTIKQKDKPIILDAIQEMGITTEVLFPDLHGFAACNAANCPISITNPTVLLAHANRAYAKHDNTVAVDLYLRYLKSEPSDPEALLALTNVCVELQDLNRALEILKSNESRIVESGENNLLRGTYFYNRGNIKAALRDHTGAIQDYTLSINHSYVFEHQSVRYVRGNSYFAIGDLQKALEEFENSGDRADAAYNAGNTLLMLGRFADAVIKYRTAIINLATSSPRVRNAHSNLLIAQQLCAEIGERSEIKTLISQDTMIGIIRPDRLSQHSSRHLPIAGNVGNQGNRGVSPKLGMGSLEGRGTQGFDGLPGGLILILDN